MPAHRDFPPRLMPLQVAARFLDVPTEVFIRLDVRPKRLGNRRLFDIYDLCNVEMSEIESARQCVSVDEMFGIEMPLPDVTSIENREFHQREPITKAVRLAVFNRDGEKCRYCGNTAGPWNLDHVFPSSRGGKSTVENLVVACATCNSEKRDRTPEEWMGGGKE